ncbi:MAG: hypothetical protein S0880_08275 [Actinomycetota bacterium]|nr:hypothetical protein [Actinomycetota bacterium]
MAPTMVANHVGTLTERSLHAELKVWFARPGDQVEVPVDGYVIDLVRGDRLVEIQTGGFGSMRRKLDTLLAADHRIIVLHPVATETWIVKETADGEPVGRRRSPKRGGELDLFAELMRIPDLLGHPGLTVGVVLVRQEEIRRDDGLGSWRRRGWSIHDRRLLEVVSHQLFASTRELRDLLPDSLPARFTTRMLADEAHIRLDLAQRVAYTLVRCGEIEQVGKDGRYNLFEQVG